MQLTEKNGAIWEQITLLRTNQTARIASDFKVDVIKKEISLFLSALWKLKF